MQDDADGNARDPDAEPAAAAERDLNGPDVDVDGNADAEADADTDADAESASVEGVDTEHVMNLTFVLTLFLGVPTVVVLSLFVPLDGWNEIISFVVRVGATIWFLTAVTLYVRERVRE